MSSCAVLLLIAALALEAQGPITLNDDGVWCWFQDERAVIHDGKLLVASVANGTASCFAARRPTAASTGQALRVDGGVKLWPRDLTD